MKHAYIYLLSALMAIPSAFAANGADIVSRQNISADSFGSLMTWEEARKNLNCSETAKSPVAALQKRLAAAATKVKANAPQAAPASIDELVSTQWDGSWQGMTSSYSGTHEGPASFVYYEQYEELDITLPDYNTGLYVGYENSNLIIYKSVNYGSNSNGDIILCPINAITGALLTTADVSIPFNEETGEFNFPATFAWGLCAVNNGQLVGYYWAASKLSIKVSEGDFSINSEIKDECTPDNKFEYIVNPGADVADVKVLILPYDGDATEHMNYVASLGTSIKGGETYTIDPVNQHVLVSQSGAMTESGLASIIFASYDAEGNPKRVEGHSLIVVLETEEGWRNIGEITYNDQLFSQYYNNFAHTQQAMLQEKEDQSGLYRLVNPYSETSVHSNECAHYFIIDATDKTWVDIPFSVTGVDLGGDGILVFGTSRALGYDKETAQANNMTAGTQQEQTITFPAKSIYCHEQYYDGAGSWSSFNYYTPVTITLPDITLNITVTDPADNPIEGAIVKTADSDEEFPTDANGQVVLNIPFETGYFGKVNITVSKADKNFTADKEISLNGANTAYTFTADLNSGIESVIIGSEDQPVYYNLQGIRVDNPGNGIYIKHQGSKTCKVRL